MSYRSCPACGNPSNGAPRPALPAGGTNTTAIVVVIIVLVLLAIPMAGILAAIAIPNFLTAAQRAKQKRTVANIHEFAVAVENYAIDKSTYPETMAALDVPKTDGWNHDLRYECVAKDGARCTTYVIASPGKDGVWEHDSLGAYEEQATTNFNCDFIFSNGSFVQYPEGVPK